MLNVFLVILIATGLFLLVYGWQKKFQLTLFFGGMALLAPLLYFIGWTLILPLVPPMALALSYIGKRKVNHA